jgi:very-short-patch-repair endonuclease
MTAVEELLTRQGGMARRRQLRKAGMSRRQLAAAVSAGRLRFVTPDLYVTADPRPDELLRAAVLRLDAVVSHHSAALLWGIELVETPEAPHVTVGRNRGGAEHHGVRVHRRDSCPDDRVVIDGVPVTTVLRTLLDLCRLLPLAEAVASVDSALRQRLTTVEELTAALCDLPAGRGRQRVARVLELMDPESGSVLESVCRVLMLEHGLATPETQLVIRQAGRIVGRVDFAWPGSRLVVETDGFAFHSDRKDYRRDRRRGNALALAGWTVLRFSWEDVMHEPDYVIASIRAALVERMAA